MNLRDRDRTDLLVVHCAATPPDMDIGAAEIDRWHRQRRFLMIGYHYVIRRDGTIEPGRPPGKWGAHARGFNHNSVGICLVGGVDKRNRPEANFTPQQYETLKHLLLGLLSQYPDAVVVGHRDLPGVTKACPSFDVQDWWESVTTYDEEQETPE